MPSDFLTEYRQRFSDYHAILNRDAYLFLAGRKAQRETQALAADYSDLFTSAALTALQQELAAATRSLDRAGLQVLLAAATHEHLNFRMRPLTTEIAAYEAHATIRWEGEAVSFAAAANLLRNEANPTRRHDLAARRAEVIKGGQDLRAERLENLQDAARALGAESYLALSRERNGVDYEALATKAQSLLTQTESRYVAALSPLLTLEAHITLDAATSADLNYFHRLTRFDPPFPAWQLKHAYRETFSGLGILTYKQDNLEIDDAVRAGKSARPNHFPVRVPDEIKITLTPRDGADYYVAFLHEIAHAQQYAWTSRNLFPEFQLAGDGAVREAFALLFGGLLRDERWLGDVLSYHESNELRHILTVQRLLRIRRHAAKSLYEVELHAGKLSDFAGARYSELLTEAVRVRYDDTEHLRDVSDDFASADYVRACAFEAQLREQLKTKYGSRWWTSRKAGDYLIDLWNTGGRYSADDMARMIDLGELSFDWLAEECLSQL